MKTSRGGRTCATFRLTCARGCARLSRPAAATPSNTDRCYQFFSCQAAAEMTLDAPCMAGCKTVMFRGTEQRPTHQHTGGVMVRLHKLFGVFEVDQRRPRRKGA